MDRPCKVLLFSGKRKSGKDYFTDRLNDKMGCGNCVIIKISGPIKSHWARLKGVPMQDLMSSNEVKEEYRKEMILWSDEFRLKDPGYFCRAALNMYKATDKLFWIVSDIRRKSDIKWFRDNYGHAVKTYRIVADEETRKKRGWTFIEGIDDAPTECDLDDVDDWDMVINNDGTEDLDQIMSDIITDLRKNRR